MKYHEAIGVALLGLLAGCGKAPSNARASVVSAFDSRVELSATSGLAANGAASATISVTVLDARKQPISGQTVLLTATGSANFLVQPALVTNASGVTSGSLTTTKAETKTITAIVDPGEAQVVLTLTPTVTFIADAANIGSTTSTVVASATSGVVANGTTSTITITVKDVNGNPVPSQTVQISSSGTSNTITQPALATDASGVATGAIASTKAEAKTITATVDPGGMNVALAQSPVITFIADVATISAGNSTTTASPPSNVLANGTATSTVTVTVLDANSNPVAGQTVQLASTGAGNTITQPASTTNASGVATGTIKSTKAETKTLTATINPGASQVVVTQTPTVAFIADVSTISSSLSTASTSPSTGVVADGSTTSTVTVTVYDANSNPVSGQTVQLASTGSGNTITQPAATTNASGVATGTIASTIAETKTLTATVNPGGTPVVIAQTPTAAFIGNAATINAGLSLASASPSTNVLADGSSVSTITVTVSDANGNPVAGQTVQLASSGTGNTITQPASTTNASGVTTGTIKSTKAETKTITATVNPGGSPVVVSQTPTVGFVADAGNISAGLSTAAASPTSNVVANGTATSAVTVTVMDANGNPVPGQTVQLAATGTGNTITQPASTTNASGVTTGTIASTKAETKTITATVNPGGTQVVVTQTPTVGFIADSSTINAGTSLASASPASNITANGSATTTVTVTVKDVNGNPVSGQTVQIASSGTGNALTQPAATTNASGVATGTVASTKAETKTITATVNPGGTPVVVTQQPTAVFVADTSTISAANSLASTNPAGNVLADGSAISTVTVTVKDANGNPVSGQTVTIAATGTSNTLTQPASTTNASGVATGMIASTKAETKTITATVNPGGTQVVVAQTPTVVFIGDASTISAGNSTESASPTSNVVADGSTTSTVTVTVKDVNGNPVSGQAVLLSSTGTSNTVVQPASTTNASGITTGTIASTKAESKTVTATVYPGGPAIVITQTAAVGFIADVTTISAGNSSASASPSSSVTANGSTSSTITVTVRDANGNPVSGQTVQLSSTGTSNTLTQPASTTNASGVATGTIASTKAETKTITATVNPGGTPVVVSLTPTVTFVADTGNISAANSLASASPSTNVVADGTTTSTVTVTVKDANGNPVSGQTVTLASTGTSNTIVQPATTTNASGITTGTIASTKGETKTITATVNPGGTPVVVTQQPTVGFIGDASTISGANSLASTSPSTGLSANGTATTTVTVTVKDVNGNAVPGQTVQLASTGTGNTITQPASTTDTSGQATGTVATTIAETKTVTATVNPGGGQVVVTQTPTAGFVWTPANTYYVRTTGSDSGAGTSPATAWATLGKAAAAVAAGDTVWVGAGTYTAKVTITTSGSSGSPIRFAADTSGYHTGDAGTVTVNGNAQRESIYINGASWIVIEGFTITGASSAAAASGGVRIANGSNCAVLSNTLYGNPNGVYVENANSTTVENNSISSNSGTTGDGVVIDNSDNSFVRNNLVYNNGRYGISVIGSSLLLTATHNTLYQNNSTQVRVDGSGNSVTLTNNVIHNGGTYGVELVAGTSSVTNDYNDVVANSTANHLGLSAGGNSISADPLFVDPDGADNVLGGSGSNDDRFQLQAAPPSPAVDAGSALATALALSDGTPLADMTTRTDAVLDSSTVDLGYHYAVTPSGLGALAKDDARLVYGEGSVREPRTRAWDESGSSWSAEASTLAAGSTIKWSVNAIVPTLDGEELIGLLSSTGSATELDLLRWSGTGWHRDWTTTAITAAHADKRGFDVAYEQSSGDALVVYSNNAATPVYRTRVAGLWSAETSLPLNDGGGSNPDPNSGVVRWIELVSRPSSNEIGLCYADANDDLVVIVWDGTQWLTATASALETSLSTNGTSATVSNRVFDAAFETTSGDLLVAWARSGATGFYWSTKLAGATSWSSAAQVATAPSTTPQFVDLAADPGGNRVAGAFARLGNVEGLGLATWSGTAWLNAGEFDAQIRDLNDAGTGDFPAAVGWVGTGGTAVCIYADNQTGTLDWAAWTTGLGWVVPIDFTVAGKGYTESVQIVSFTGQSELMALVSDSNSDLWAVTYDGTNWSITNSGTALETGLSAIDSMPFGFRLRDR